MHDNVGVEIHEEEVFLALVTQALDGGGGGLPRVLLGEAAGLLLPVVVGQDAVGRFHHVLGLQLAVFQQVFLEQEQPLAGIDEEAGDRQGHQQEKLPTQLHVFHRLSPASQPLVVPAILFWSAPPRLGRRGCRRLF